MTVSEPPGSQPAEPDGPALQRAAEQAGSLVSDRMLETFRAQGLIPRARRVGNRGRRPKWLYPPGTDRQLIALLRWRKHTKDADLLKVLLWMDGFAISAAEVRDILARQLLVVTEAIEREISAQAGKLGLDPGNITARDQAIDAIAKTMAAKRGTTPLPRRSRVSADDRAHAVALMIRLFGLGETIAGTPAEASAVERVIGIAPNGRRNAIAETGPWLTGPSEDLFDAGSITGLPHLLSAITNASDAELTAARQTVIALFRHLPLMVRMIAALSGEDNYTGLATMNEISQRPESVLYIVPTVVAMQRAGWTESLDAVTLALRQAPGLAAQAQQVLDMPQAAIEANLAGEPPEVRARTYRLIDAAVEGQFDDSFAD